MTAQKELITRALVAALQAIVTGATYPITVSKVVRPTRSLDYQVDDYWITVEQVEAFYEKDDNPGPERTQNYWVTGWIALSDKDQLSIDERLNDFEASIETALGVDHTLGGLTLNVKVTGSEPEARAAFEGIRVEVEVLYDTSSVWG